MNEKWKANATGQQFAALLAAQPDQALLVFDFDGTLSEIVPNPPDARIVQASADAIARLAGVGVRVAIISGRPVATLLELSGAKDRSGFERAIVFGHYGAEKLDLETGIESSPEPPVGVAQAKESLRPIADRYPGAHLEDKGLAVALHLRQTTHPEQAFKEVEGEVRQVAAQTGLVVEPGRYVWELRAASIDKGQALQQLLDDLEPTAVAFAGDDLGDLPAFRVLKEHTGPQLKCSVVSASPETPGLLPLADVLCDGPKGVAAWLLSLADLVDASSTPL